MSETATENPVPKNSEKPSTENPIKTEEITEKIDKVKLESNGVPKTSGDPPKKMSSQNLSTEQKAFKEIFTTFSKFGDTTSDGKKISLSQR